MKKRDEGKVEMKEIYTAGKERVYCDGCGQEICSFDNMQLQFNDFGDDEERIPAHYEQWDFCGFRCYGKWYTKHENKKKIARLLRMTQEMKPLQFHIVETDLSVMADAANLLNNE